MKKTLGVHGIFFLYTGLAFCNAIWGFLTIQDNRGKSLAKIEEENGKKKKNTSNKNQQPESTV